MTIKKTDKPVLPTLSVHEVSLMHPRPGPALGAGPGPPPEGGRVWSKPRIKRTRDTVERAEGDMYILRPGDDSDLVIERPDERARGAARALDGTRTAEELAREFGRERVRRRSSSARRARAARGRRRRRRAVPRASARATTASSATSATWPAGPRGRRSTSGGSARRACSCWAWAGSGAGRLRARVLRRRRARAASTATASRRATSTARSSTASATSAGSRPRRRPRRSRSSTRAAGSTPCRGGSTSAAAVARGRRGRGLRGERAPTGRRTTSSAGSTRPASRPGVPFITMSHSPPVARVGPLYVPGDDRLLRVPGGRLPRALPALRRARRPAPRAAVAGGHARAGVRVRRRPGGARDAPPGDRPVPAGHARQPRTSTTCAR